LGKDIPVYAHLPTVLNEQGDKMSKRSGAKAVTQYAAEGYLPDAMVNYLARLGWSHGDDEIFSREQFVQWFNLDHLGKSAAQFDEAKLRWVNAQHLKALPDEQLASLVAPFVQQQGVSLDAARTLKACALFKDRCSTLVELAGWIALIEKGAVASAEDMATHVTAAVQPALASLAKALSDCEWSKPALAAVIKQVLADAGLKMPQLAMPVRVLLLGTPQTPSLDAVIELMPRNEVIARLKGGAGLT
jgi:glutamyl-tRNA synthetase